MLISCVMPIADRHDFIPGVLACFDSQDWPSRELIVIDNGRAACFDFFAGRGDVQYHRVRPGYTIGALRNLACSRAQGEYVAHWDSDDWYGPQRLSRQFLLLNEADVTGYHNLRFADDRNRRAWMYRHSPPYACGATLMYRRSAWERSPFRTDCGWGEDNAFVRSLKGRLVSVAGADIVARVHAGGTSPRDTRDYEEIDYSGLAELGYPVMAETICGRG
jgi:glycosyltransferase involved in cell wall biosynthesis